ncbi:sodium/potassium/calcium exchanger 4-like isoform X2 [Hyposmocoma kahamanoa]|uniref:sodium/potassium/calcium exchanger 4-like isoform X2 n=1 Tax=Hyposmocoma kahamanoa TaxID=1477025 RepID=UPI000E6DA14E|nr:sodium/potassium/calcium exchanger 4-like isoform X2 [Hyposmocoma kahamanoa]
MIAATKGHQMEKYSVFVALALCICATAALDIENDTVAMGQITYVNYNGELVLATEELIRKLEEEDVTWHWTPWLRTRTKIHDNELMEIDCIDRNALESFPPSIFTDDQLRKGGFLCYVLFVVYLFTLLGYICNDYFIPCVEMICEDLNIPKNVAAATFMSVATSCPEFFVNVISTFLTDSAMGIGTIMGSAIFNTLGVGAIGGLAAIFPIAIEWKPVTRDVIIYIVNVSVLMIVIWDGQVDWYEAMVLFILYILYFIIIFNSARIFSLVAFVYGKCCNCNNNLENNNNTKQHEEGIDNKGYENNNSEKVPSEPENIEDPPVKGVFEYPKGESVLAIVWWWYTLPIRLILFITIPSPFTCRMFYPFAFFMCIVWIGANSYLVSWCMTVIGHTFYIPDSVMGMTFLAFGGCLPEACSIFIMSRRGEGGVGVSNALGANSLAILFALGTPWLIKTLVLVGQGADEPAIVIDSSGIAFVVTSLLLAVTLLWVILFLGKFKLRKSVGGVLCVLYLIFITFGILVEIGVIFDIEQLSFCF